MRAKKNKKVKDNKNNKYQAYLLYICFGITIFLSINILLAFLNICYLPPNTTGECIIARSIISLNHFLIFLIFESIFSGMVTILYLIDGFKYKIKKYLIISFLNILLQPFVILFAYNFVGRLL